MKELIEKYQEELKELCKYDNDTKDIFGFINSWWVFGEVAKELNYKIFMAEVENVGYKRTKRSEKPMPNDHLQSLWDAYFDHIDQCLFNAPLASD